MSYKKKKRKIKWKNILKLLVVLITIIFAFNFIKKVTFNNKVYNNINGSNLTINSNKKNIKLSEKNIDYITKSNVKVKIISKGNSYIINNEEINKKTSIRLNTYTKRIHKTEFNNSKALFIDDKKIDNGNISIKLPSFLSKN